MVLILTPLEVERSALDAALRELGVGDSFALRVGGHGKVQFALATQVLIQKLSPRLVVCAGAAGALSAEVRTLDVVVATATIEHDFRLRFVKRPLPTFAGNGATLEEFRRLTPLAEFTTHFGAIASGDEDILDRARAEEVRALTGAVAVAWEGAGAARACALHGVPFVEVRAITDSADAGAVEHFRANVEVGMRNLARLFAAGLVEGDRAPVTAHGRSVRGATP